MKANEPKEYWINVYSDGYVGYLFTDKRNAIEAMKSNIRNGGYRIHVKMDGGYNKRFGKDVFYQRIWKDGQSVLRYKIGETIRIRLPEDFKVVDKPMDIKEFKYRDSTFAVLKQQLIYMLKKLDVSGLDF